MNDPRMPVTLNLTLDDVEKTLQGITLLPYNMVERLVQKVREQTNHQIQEHNRLAEELQREVGRASTPVAKEEPTS